MNKKTKILSSLCLLIMMGVFVSGCGKQPPVVNHEQEDQVATKKQEPEQGDITEPKVITSDIDTSDWKTYRNEEYGFEVKYPDTWEHKTKKSGFVEFKDNMQKVYFEGSETYLMSISVQNFNNSSQLEKYVKDWKSSKLANNGWVKDIKINKINGIQGYNFFGLSTLVNKGNTAYVVTKGVFSPEYVVIDKIYQGFLNSWKFID